ncbi:MAG: sugar ABC transporter permease [Anaerolineae bacterium]|nr:sugar ABC transporter permease [Anaerolineae bacterium]
MSDSSPVLTPAVQSSTSAWRKQWFSEDTLVAWIFLLPSLVGFIAFYLAPAVRAVMISFTDWDMLTPATFVGIDNYVRMVNDRDFWNALKVTSIFVFWNISVQTVFALLLAAIMSRLTQSNIIRSIMLLPWLLSNVVVALLWMWLLDPTLGIINVTIERLGFDAVAFLGNPKTALVTIALITVWRYLGYTALLIFSGMQSIDGSVYEAGSIDGASEWTMFWKITMPLLRPVLVFVMVTSIIGSFQVFDMVAVTTKGGPINATKVFNWLIFEQAFERFNMGYATTLSVTLFLILVVVSFAQMRLLRADEVD